MKKLCALILTLCLVTGLFAPASAADEAAEAQKLTAHQQHLVMFAALFHVEDPIGLPCVDDVSELEETLAQTFGITSHQSAARFIEDALGDPNTELHRLFSDLLADTLPQAPDCTEEEEAYYASIKEYVDEQMAHPPEGLPLTPADMQAVKSLAAWDLLVAANAVRMGVACKLLGEEEAWAYLERIAKKAEATYETWAQFYAAISLAYIVNSGNYDSSFMDSHASVLFSDGLWSGKLTDEPDLYKLFSIDASALSAAEKSQLLALGAIYTPDDLSDLALGGEQAQIKADLQKTFGISNHASAQTSLEAALQLGKREYYNNAMESIASGAALIQAAMGDLDKDLFQQMNSIYRSVTQALQEKLEYVADEVFGEIEAPRAVSALDFATATYLARACYTGGYLSEQEAWSYIARAAKKTAQEYTSWRDYFANFLFGYAFVNGPAQIDDFCQRAALLFEEGGVWAQTAIKLPALL